METQPTSSQHPLTHLAFYAGWPNAMTAITQLKAIADKNEGE